MRPHTIVNFLQEEREKLRKGALMRMLERWAVKPRPEAPPKADKTKKGNR
jgi:hypothetical protein